MPAAPCGGRPATSWSRILRKSKANNPALGITGVLCFSEGIFLQVLEGGRSAVNRLYNRIAADPRHTDVELLATRRSASAASPAGRWGRSIWRG